MLAQSRSFAEWVRVGNLPVPLRILFMAAHASKSTKVLGFGLKEAAFAEVLLDRVNADGKAAGAYSMLLRYRDGDTSHLLS